MPLTEAAQTALAGLAELSGTPAVAALSAEQLLMERAHLTGAHFQHRRTPSGLTRLLDASNGTLALALVRPTDWELLPAWLETDGFQASDAEDGWQVLAKSVAKRNLEGLIERGRLLGLALASTEQPVEPTPPTWLVSSRSSADRNRPPRVIDLSALWAGPLASHLLGMCGADVIKVESSRRPDGAREGNRAFYDLLNHGKRSLALDLAEPDGRKTLEACLVQADIVIESSRPRALRQMGIRAEEMIARRPGLIWISLTGYGRSEPAGNWVAFGDDAGVAAGLSQVMRAATGDYQFAGDAIADPLTGIQAAYAAAQAWHEGQGGLLELSLAGIAAWSLAREKTHAAERLGDWWSKVTTGRVPGTARQPLGTAALLGAHTSEVLEELGVSC